MKNLGNKTRLLLGAMIIGAFLMLNACDADEDEGGCSGCEADAPYSTSTSGSCYATLADCQDAHSSGCQRCD